MMYRGSTTTKKKKKKKKEKIRPWFSQLIKQKWHSNFKHFFLQAAKTTLYP
jgi:hypothetical protein